MRDIALPGVLWPICLKVCEITSCPILYLCRWISAPSLNPNSSETKVKHLLFCFQNNFYLLLESQAKIIVDFGLFTARGF